MKAPPGLLAASLALWGYASGQWWVALTLALVIEGARWFPLRIELGPRGFARLAMATRIAFLSLLGVHLTQSPVPSALLAALSWAPVAFAIVLVPQLYSVNGLAPLNVLRMFRAGDRDRAGIDLSMPFFGVTLLAAAGSAQDVPYFFSILAIIVGWALALVGPMRASRDRRVVAWAYWLVAYGLVVTLAQTTHVGLSGLQRVMEERVMALMDEWMQSRAPSDRTRTRIGDLGRVKLSDRIVLRVEPEAPLLPPFLVRDGAYSRLEGGMWTNRGVRSQPFAPADRGGVAELVQGAGGTPSGGAATFTIRTRGQTTVMPIPFGTVGVHTDDEASLTWNGRGTLASALPPAILRYRALVDPRVEADAPPTEEDLAIPVVLRQTLDDVYGEARLDGLAGSAAVRGVRSFFSQQFRYTLFLGDHHSGGRTLSDFLLRDRAGHCEYFASATVLLLRRAGIPARYATGYSVEEWSELEQQYVVRGAHGHAWALAWVGGRWTEVDTTPAIWRDVEEKARRSMFDGLSDLWALAMLRIDQWRSTETNTDSTVWIVLVIVIGVVAALRGTAIIRRRKSVGPGHHDVAATARSPLADLEAYFRTLGAARAPGQSLRAWIAELEAAGRVTPQSASRLALLVARYYRHRFGPQASTEDREIRADATRWLEEQRRAD